MVEGPLEAALVPGVEPLEDPAAPHKEPVEPSSETPVLRLLVLASEPLQAQEWGDRSRDQEGGEERERDGEGQRDEEQPRLALQEDRGQENDDGGDGGHEDRHGHFAGGVEHRLAARLARYVEVTVDVLELHDRIVHKTADGEGEPAQGEDIEGLAEEVHGNEGQQEGQGNGNRDDDGRHE